MNAAGVSVVAPQTTLIDLEYLGNPSTIASYLLELPGGIAIVDPGPSVALPVLLSKLRNLGLSVEDIRFILLTHIHLDHAGATGTLVGQNSRIRVFVHEFGAKHMADPSKLLRSAERLYGDDMKRLWGDFRAVPVQNIQGLSGGEQLKFDSRKFEVAYTPGHASHHVSYFDLRNGLAFVGDTAGVRISHGAVLPVTPPPDIDLEKWSRSLDEIEKRKPERLLLTHFGPSDVIGWHLGQLRIKLNRWGAVVRDSLQRNDSDPQSAIEFTNYVVRELKGILPEEDVQRYERTMTPSLSWYGLARYWRKRAEAQLNP